MENKGEKGVHKIDALAVYFLSVCVLAVFIFKLRTHNQVKNCEYTKLFRYFSLYSVSSFFETIYNSIEIIK